MRENGGMMCNWVFLRMSGSRVEGDSMLMLASLPARKCTYHNLISRFEMWFTRRSALLRLVCFPTSNPRYFFVTCLGILKRTFAIQVYTSLSIPLLSWSEFSLLCGETDQLLIHTNAGKGLHWPQLHYFMKSLEERVTNLPFLFFLLGRRSLLLELLFVHSLYSMSAEV